MRRASLANMDVNKYFAGFRSVPEKLSIAKKRAILWRKGSDVGRLAVAEAEGLLENGYSERCGHQVREIREK